MGATNDTGPPAWAKWWLRAAGVYNLVWGAVIIAFPHLLFDLCGLERMRYPQIWQCVGMIVGVYGIGYFIAAKDPYRHWPIVLVGLLGKILGPIGFVKALADGTFPPAFGLTILTNDLVWWIPFAMILWAAAMHCKRDQRSRPESCLQYLRESRIAARPDVVFRYHESPNALLQLIPPWENMKVAESPGSLLPGSKVVLRGGLGFFPIQWVAIHTEYDPPHLFADFQESGPFAWWYHRHRFIDDGKGGTILRDEVEYQAPLGWIGRRLGGWLIRRKLDNMFAYRHETTRRMIESGEWTDTQPKTMQPEAVDDR